MSPLLKKVRVIVVDDSAMVRDILTKGLASDPGIEVVATASDPYIARDKIIETLPDVMTLDVEMPRMDGVEFLRRLMPQYPIPVVMVSSLTDRGKKVTLDALQAGAVDFVLKPGRDVARSLEAMMMELRTKVKIASTANVSHWKHKKSEDSVSARQSAAICEYAGQLSHSCASSALAESTDKVIAIGASTGGTEAIKDVISKFPAMMPGTVIVQHMPAGFTKMFSERLNTLCQMEVKEAEDGDRIMTGRVLVAPGAKQMSVKRSGGTYIVKIDESAPLVNGHKPSVEVLFKSVAEYVGANAVGVMLTGMGGDGADGMKAMRDAGARTVAQGESTCVVFGMPKVAWERGGAETLCPLPKIAERVVELLKGT